MPLDIYAALGALVRAEAARETQRMTDVPQSGEREHKRPECDNREDTGAERK
jgi:hypothetical protein